MGLIRVSASTLKSQAEQLQQYNEQFKAAVSDLENTEAQLNSMWEGEANTAFHNAFTSDKVQMSNFANAIVTYVVALNNIAAKYEQAESTNTETASTRTY